MAFLPCKDCHRDEVTLMRLTHFILIASALVIFIFPHKINQLRQQTSTVIFWWVGQGQMVSYHSGQTCLLFDFGGDILPQSDLLKLCGRGTFRTEIYISHLDSDHIRFLKRPLAQILNICHRQGPTNPFGIQPCNDSQEQAAIEIIYKGTKRSRASKNQRSWVYGIENKVLLPGDSSKHEEQEWGSHKLVESADILSVGHHGSKTSSSPRLLRNLKNATTAVVSAKKRRYGHPHPTVLKNFKSNLIPVLKNEDWGHIIYILE